MLYKFYCKYECNYNGKMLYYGYFWGDKPCWNADIGDDKLEPLVAVDDKVSKDALCHCGLKKTSCYLRTNSFSPYSHSFYIYHSNK